MSSNRQTSLRKQMLLEVDYCKNNVKDVTMSALQLKLEQISDLKVEFMKNQNDLEEACEQMKELDEQIALRSKFNDQFHFCHVALKDRLTALEDAKALKAAEAFRNQNGGANDGANRQKVVKLPKIEIAQFNGHYENWTAFHDLFHSLIHTNESIDDVQKLQYLRSSVINEAETLIKSIPITEANYAEAWKRLKDRYNHKRFIVDSLLKSFFSQPKLMQESHIDIKILIDKSSETIQGLKLQGVPVDQWDVILVHVVVSKLDSGN